MPRYQFAIDGEAPAPEVEGLPNDVTALKWPPKLRLSWAATVKAIATL